MERHIVGSRDGCLYAGAASGATARIHASGAKIVTVAAGTPKQGIAHARLPREVHPHAPYGGGIPMMCLPVHVKRAPKIWQNSAGVVVSSGFSTESVLPARCVRCATFAGTILAISYLLLMTPVEQRIALMYTLIWPT